jgi:hypothetical protein
MFTVFWDSQEVLLAHFQKRGENVNSSLYCGEVLLTLLDAIRRKHTGQLVLQSAIAPSDFHLFVPLKKTPFLLFIVRWD